MVIVCHYIVVEFAPVCTLADLEEQTQVISCLLIHLAGATELVVPSPWLEMAMSQNPGTRMVP
jgi:hypothetical protein